MIKRPRQLDYLRTVTRINEWDEFNSFENDNQLASQQGNNSIAQNGDKNEKDGIQKKQEIPIIAASNIKTQNSISNIQNITDELYKKRRIHQSNYIRIRQDQIWPLSEKYELADDDIVFLKDFNQTNKFNMKEEELESMIESFEMKSGKDFIVTWIVMKDHIPYEDRDKYTFPNLEKIYNYWKIKRDLLKRPLLRLHWKPNFDEKDPHVAFRPRVAKKMQLRKQMNKNDDEQVKKLSALKEEMLKYKLLVQQIKLREQMKEWILEAQNIQFVNEIYKVDKSMQYFFVDDVFENHKDFEQKKQQMDQKIGVLYEEKNKLNKQLQQYNLFTARPVSDIIGKHNKLIKPTSSTTFSKDPKVNPEVAKSSEVSSSGAANTVNGLSSTTISIPTGLSKKEQKKASLQSSRLIADEMSPQIDQIEPEKKKHKDTLKLKKDDQLSEADQTLKISKSGSHQTQKESSLTSTIQSQTLKNSDKLKKDQEQPIKQSQKASKKDIKQDEVLKQIAESPNIQGITNEKDSNLIGEKDNQKSIGDVKESPALTHNGMIKSNTNNFEFAAFLASIFIEASKQELSIDMVCNPDSKNFNSEHYQHILNSKSELAQQLKKLKIKQNIQNSGQHISKHQPINHDPQGNNHPNNINVQMQNNQNIHNHQYSQDHYANGMNGQRQQQMAQQRAYDQIPQQGSQIQGHQNEIPNAKRKNVIPFKPRFRTGRSGFVIIDRLFDDKDNLRYEDICSKLANYHPNKVVDKIMAQELMKVRDEQQKLKVFSFSSNDRELYNKDYFQQRKMKFKQLAEDNDDVQYLQTPFIPPQTPTISNNNLNNNLGQSQFALNGVNSTSIKEGTQMQIEDNTSNLMLSSSMSSQQINNDQDFKYLKKTISTALKNYQKSKQQSQLK